MSRLISRSRLVPFLVLSALIGTILLGMFFLKLPGVLYQGSMSWINALFISTSAACTTGISPLSFDDFTFFGQIILLGLVQLGGISLVIILVALAFFFTHPDLQWHTLATHIFETINIEKIRNLVKVVIVYTLVIESLGTLLLYGAGKIHGCPISLFQSALQSVNLFCNAGFQLSPAIQQVIATNTGLMISAVIITLGCLGFLFAYEWYEYLHAQFQGKLYTFSTTIRVAGKVYFYTTGAVFIALLWHSLSSKGAVHAFCWSLAHACSLRSYGILIPGALAALSSRMMLAVGIYSFFGGSPLSTSGGIRSSIIGLIGAFSKMLIKGDREIILCGRAIPYKLASKAFFFCLYIAALTSILACCLDAASGTTNLGHWIAESAGSVNTSGTTSGTISEYGSATKSFLLLGMILGRLGFLVFLLKNKKNATPQRPEDSIMLL